MSIYEWAMDLACDVRYAVRMMRRERAFSLFIMATLALGVGANAFMGLMALKAAGSVVSAATGGQRTAGRVAGLFGGSAAAGSGAAAGGAAGGAADAAVLAA